LPSCACGSRSQWPTRRRALAQQKLDADIVRFKAEQNERLFRGRTGFHAGKACRRHRGEEGRHPTAPARTTRCCAPSGDGGGADRSAETELRTAREERGQSQRQLDLAMARSDRDGVLTWVVPEIGATLRRGDIWPAWPTSRRSAWCPPSSDVHASRVAAGMPAAREDRRRDHRQRHDRQRRPAHRERRRSILGRPRLRRRIPSCATTCASTSTPSPARAPNVLQLRRGSLGDADHDGVFVVRGDTAFRTAVRFGMWGEENVEMVDGLREGDEVVISMWRIFRE